MSVYSILKGVWRLRHCLLHSCFNKQLLKLLHNASCYVNIDFLFCLMSFSIGQYWIGFSPKATQIYLSIYIYIKYLEDAMHRWCFIIFSPMSTSWNLGNPQQESKQPLTTRTYSLQKPPRGSPENRTVLSLRGTGSKPLKQVRARWEELNKAAKIQQHCGLFQTTVTITYTGCPLHKHQCDFVDCWDSVCCNWHKLPQASNHKKLTLAKAHFTLHCCSTVLN